MRIGLLHLWRDIRTDCKPSNNNDLLRTIGLDCKWSERHPSRLFCLFHDVVCQLPQGHFERAFIHMYNASSSLSKWRSNFYCIPADSEKCLPHCAHQTREFSALLFCFSQFYGTDFKQWDVTRQRPRSWAQVYCVFFSGALRQVTSSFVHS